MIRRLGFAVSFAFLAVGCGTDEPPTVTRPPSTSPTAVGEATTSASESPVIEVLPCDYLAESSLRRRIGLSSDIEVVSSAQYKEVRDDYDVLIANLKSFGLAAWAVPEVPERGGDENRRPVLALNEAASEATGRSIADGPAITAAIGDPDAAPLLSCLE